MKRPFRTLGVAAGLVLAPVGALAGGPLAVGEAIPLYHPPGFEIRPVYTPPVMHSRWTPVDTSLGHVFRETVYTAPPGYVYRYVRGYTRVRLADPAVYVVKPVAKKTRTARKTSLKGVRRSCVTDSGYGRYDTCP